jgi:hypothetical protein
MSTTKKARREWSDAEKARVVEAVLRGMAEGQTLQDTAQKVAREEQLAVTPGLVRTWIVAQEEWFRRYQKTKALLGQAFAEEAIQIARESTSQSTAIDRVLIETLKWAAAKANPVEYGEKQTVEHQGAQTLQVKIVEDDPEVRNPKAISRAGKDAVALAVVSAPTLMLGAPVGAPALED